MRKIYLLLLLCCISVAGFGQTISAAKYPFSTGAGTSLQDMSSGTTSVIGSSVDDAASSVFNIGFDFWFVGVRYTQFSCNSNGLMRLGGTAVSSALGNILNSGTNNPKITGLWDDLSTGSNGGVRYLVTGTEPNRKCVIEWFNMNVPYCVGCAGTSTWQVWLFESTGRIDFRYGGTTTSTSASIGICNASGVYGAISSSGNSCSYTTSNNGNTAAIASGRRYTFTPLIPADPTGINFTSVTGTSMVVNWTAASPTTNIYGYALYRSTDGGATYTYVNSYSGATTATAGTQSGLTAGVTYTWKVLAYTEGGLSNPLVGSQATTASPCTGTPTPGTVSASTSSGCSAYSTTLSLSGATTGVSGLNYQWQTSSDNSSWSNISGATNSTYGTTVSASGYYRCIVGCTPTGFSANTPGLFLGLSTCYSMTFNGTASATTCGGLFYDDGGAGGDYGINGTSIYTFYPAATGTGSKVSVHFNSLSVEACCDYLQIYNGNSTGATLVGTYTSAPSDFTSTASDGSLTFKFYSDISINSSGFNAVITTTSVNPISANPSSSTVTCQGYSPVLTMGVNGTSSTYEWYDNGGTNTTSGGTPTGVTTATFSPSTTTVGTKYYYCVVTTACGATYTTTPASGVTVNASPAALTGTLVACSGNTSLLASSTGGGTWSTSSGIASVSAGGLVTAGGTSGTTTVSYIVAGCAATGVFTVNANPGTTTGTFTVCSGATTTLSNPGGLGTWSSANTSVATVGSSSGIVTGVSGGTAAISYSNGCGSPVGSVVTVLQTPGAITGAGSACVGASVTLGNPNTGGTWASSTPAVATIVSGTGSLTGVTPGTTTITYDLGNGCAVATRIQTVNLAPPAVSIAPGTAATICLTNSSTFTASTSPTVNVLNQNWNAGMLDANGGTWSISNIAGIAASYWQIRSSPGYASVGGDGTPMMQAASDALNGVTSTIVTSPSFSLAGYASASLTFNQYYLSLSGADITVAIEYSTNGGGAWSTLLSQINTTTGTTTWSAATPTTTVSLASLIGQPNVMFRWNYSSDWGWHWAIDNIKVTATYATPSFTWAGISGATGLSCTSCATSTLTPTALGANIYSVTATANGCSSTSGVTLTTEQAGAVSVTGGGTYCGSALLTASGGTGGTIYFQGTTSNGTSTATPATTRTVTSSGTYYFRARTSTASCWGTQGSVTVTINAVPSAAPTNSGPICNGGTVTLTANPGANTSVYSWSGPNLSSTTAQNPTATPTVTSVYSLTVTDGSGNTGCSPTTVYTTSVTVNTTPTAAPTNSGPICNGGTVTLTANPATGASVYAWSGPNLSSATAQNPTATPTVTSVYSLTVSDGSGFSGCSPTTVYTTSVTVRPTPGAAPTNNGYICNGGTVTLSANPANSASVYTWSGTALSSTTAQNPTATPTSTTVYSLVVTDGSGESGCSPSTVYTTSVTVNTTPTASPSNDGPICNGGTVTLTASPAGGASAYTWSGSSLASTTLQNPTATPTTTSTYSLTVSDGSSQPGCSPSTVYTTSVTVNTTPTAAPTNSGPICNGGTVTLTANPATGASVYSWSGPNLSSTTTQNPTASPTVTTVYSLTVSDGSGFSGCSPTTVYTTSVTVRPTPSAAPTNNGYICNGGTVTLSANPINSASVFTWSGVSLASTTAQNPTATPTVTGVYSLTVTDGSGQSGCSPTTVYTTSVTVNTTPTASPTNDGPICNGGTVTLTANPAGGASAYSWSGSSVSSATAENPTATPTVTSTYSLTVSDGSSQPGCSPSTVYTTSVSVNTTPTAAPTNNGYICNGGTVTLSANPATGASVYTWSGVNLSSTTAQNPTATPTVTSTYSLTVTDGSGFSGCSPTTIYTTTVTVNSKPTAAPSNDGYICNGGTVTLAANPANGAAAYSWSGSSLSSSVAQNPTATPTVTSVYSLTVTDGSTQPGCSPADVYTTSVTVNTTPTAAPSNSSPICNGGTVTLTANPSGGASTYSWSGANLAATTLANPTATPTVTTVYSLTVTDGSSQPGCSPVTIYTTSVTVNSTPTAAPTNNGYICNGGTVTLSANPGGSTNTYAWSGPNLTSTTLQNPTATPTVTSTYSLTVTNGTGASGCTPSTVYTTTVTVNDKPTAAPTNSSPICNGGTVTLTANPANGASTYSWSGTSVSSATAQNPTATPTTTSIYSLTVTDGSTQPGCSPADVYTTSVTVNAAPTLTGASNDGPLCEGVTLHLSADGAADVTGYSWTGPVAITGAATTTASVPGATTAATGIYTVVVNNATGSGCTATYTTSATVNTIPTVASITPSTTNVCTGTAVTFTAGSVSGSGSVTSYNWSGPNAYSATTGTNTAVLTPTTTAATGVYTLSVTYTGIGCTSNPVTSASVTVNNLPTMTSIGVSPTNLCAGAVLSLTGNGASGTGSLISYNWAGPNSYSSTTGTSTQVYTTPDAAASGIYSVTVTYTGTGCTSNPVTSTAVTVNALPIVYNVTGGGFYCSGGTGVNVGIDGSETGVNYQLYLGASAVGTPLAGNGSPLDFGLQTASGTYSVVATNATTSCPNNMSGTTTVSVGAVPVVYAVTGGGGYCAGGSGVVVGLSNSQVSVSYQLYKDGVIEGAIVAGTGAAFNFGSFTLAGNYTVVANPSAACASTMSGSATVYINPLPNIYNVSGGGQYCAGGVGLHINQDFSVVGINYQLYRGSTPVGSPIAGASSGLDLGLQTVAGTYSVMATNATTSCVNGMSGMPTITVNALPVQFTVTGGGNYCSGGAGNTIGITGSEAGVNYQLYNGSTAVGSPFAGTGSSFSFGSYTAAGTYTVLATNATTSCVKDMGGSATVVMNALPVVYTVSGGGQYCSGSAGVHIGLSNSEIGVNYQLYNGSTAVGSALPGASSGLDFGVMTAAGTYSVRATNATTACGSDMTGTATVVVNPLPTAHTVTGGATICSSSAGTAIGLNSSTSGINYQLYNGSSAVGSPVAGTGAAVSFGLQATAGTYTVRATNATTSCVNGMTGSATVIVNAVPTAFAVTGGGQYCAGGSGFNVGLAGSQAGVNYQLYRGSSAIGSTVAGTGSSFNFGVQTTAGTYTVSATNASTSCTNDMTGSVAIVVNALPTAYTVTGGGAYCNGGSGVSVGLNNSTVGINYQLYNGGSTVGSPVAGTGSSLDFGLQTAAGTYSVVATNATTTCANNMTGTASVTINAVPTVYAVTGGGNFCAGGSGVAVGLSNSNSGINYQLYRGATAVGSALAGTGAALNFGNQTTAGTYTVLATDAGTSCTSNMSSSATVIVLAVPTAYTVTGGGNYCAGGTGVTVGLVSSNTGINYQLYRGAVTVGSTVAGTGSSLDFGLQTAAGTYTVLATDAVNSCTSNMVGSVAVVVNPLPTTYNVTGGGQYCAGGVGVHVGMSFTNSGVNYQLYRGSTAIGSPIAGASSSIDFGLQTVAGTYSVQATNATTSCVNDMTGTATVVVNPLPIVYTVTGGGQYCAGGSGVAVGLSNSESSVSYQLYNGTSVSGSPVAGTGAAISFGLQTAAGTYTVYATNTTTTCVNNMSGSATVVVNPLPIEYNVTGGGTLCSGDAGYHIGLSNSQTGINYQLYNGSTVSGSPVAGTGAALDFGVFTVAGTYSVHAVNATTSCENDMNSTAIVIVNPLPIVKSVTGGGAYCNGGAGVAVGISSSDIGINYQLYRGASAVGSPLAGTGAVLSFGLQTVAGAYSVVATNATTGCVKDMSGSATVVVNPLPTVYTVTGGGAYCAGGAGVSVGLSGSTGGVNYRLYLGSTAYGSLMPGTGGALNFGLLDVEGTYTVFATNPSTSCTSNMTGGAVVVVNPLPTQYTVSGSGSFCAGGSGINVVMSGSQAGIYYQLYNGATPTGSLTPGTGSAIDFGAQTAGGTYSVMATNIVTGCSRAMIGSSSVTVLSLPTVHTVTGGGAYCAGGIGVNVGLTASNIGVNYQLYNGSTPVGSVFEGSGMTFSFGLQTAAGSYTVRATNIFTGCMSNMAGNATISINPLPVAQSVSGGGSYCSGGAGLQVCNLAGSETGVTYQLYRGSIAVGSPVAGTGGAIGFGLQTLAGTYSVLATNTATGCTNAMGGTSTIVINPLPTTFGVSGGGSYCNGGTGVGIGLSGSATGINYQLYSGSAATGSSVPGTGSSISFGSVTSAGTYTVRATNATTGCVNGMTGSALIIVNPLPTAYTVTGGGNYCIGGIGVPVGLSSSSAGITYQLYRGGTLAASLPGTGSALNFGLQTSAATYSVMATNTTTGCTNGMTGGVAVGINSLPITQVVTGGGSYCVGDAGVHIGLPSTEAGINYQLYRGSSIVGAAVAGSGSGLDFGLQTAAGAYSVSATNSTTGCNSNMSGVAVVIVNSLPMVQSVTGGGNYCAGGTGVLVGLDGSETGVNYRLYNGATAVGAAVAGTGSAISFGLQTAAGTYTVVANNPTTTCTLNMSASATVVVNTLPISFTVSGGGTNCAGSAGFNISLSGSTPGVSYQLYNGTTMVGTAIVGAGSAINFGTFTAAGTYSVLATNTTTTCSKWMTGAATINVNPQPTAYNVTGGGAYCLGGAGLHVGLSGSTVGINYQLYNGATPSGVVVAGTGGVLDFGLKTGAGSYSVAATNPLTGCTGTMSGGAIIAVNALPIAQNIAGGGSYCAGGTGVFVTLSGSQTGVNYQLYNGTTGIGSPVAGTGTGLSFGLQTAAGIYTVLAINVATSCTETMTGSAPVVISPLPVAQAVTGGGNYCAGGTGVTIGLGGSQAGITYQLYNGSSPSGAALAGTGSALSFGNRTANGTYSVLATNPVSGCSTAMTGSATVNTNVLPVVYTVTGGGSYCVGSAGVHVGLSGSSAGVNYQLYNGAALAGSMAGTGDDLDFGVETIAGTYSVLAVNPLTSCSVAMTDEVIVSVNTLPVVQAVTGGGNYCAGGTGVNIGLSSSEAIINYQLYNGATAVGSVVTGTGSVISFGMKTAAGVYTVLATNAITGCAKSMAGSATISVNPLPAAYTLSGGGNFCAGGTSAPIMLDGSTSGVTYRLYNGSTIVGSPVFGTGSPISFGTVSTSGTYSVMATNSTTTCAMDMMGVATVVVNPLPVAYAVTGGGNYCAGGTGVNVGLNNSEVGVAYQLYNGTTPVGAPMAGTGNSLSFGTQTNAGTYTIVGRNVTTLCSNTMSGSSVVAVNAVPVVYNVTGGGAYCVGGSGFNIGIDGSQFGAAYQLYNGTTPVGSQLTGTGAALDFGVKTAAGTYVVVVTDPTHGCASNMAGTGTISINSLPVVHNVSSGGSYCAGGAGVSVSVDGSEMGVNYSLYNGTSAVGAPLAGTGAAVNFGAQTAAGNYTVMAADAVTGCSVAMTGIATIIVNPLPAVHAVVASGSAYCAGGTGIVIMLDGSNTGVNYTIYNGGIPAGTVMAGTGLPISFGNKTALGVYTVVGTNAVTGCSSNMAGSAPVIANPLPSSFLVTGGGAMCAGSTGLAVNLSGSQTGVNYTLYNGSTAIGSPVAGDGTALTFGLQSVSGTYTVVAVNAATGCSRGMSSNAMITINSLPTAYNVTGGGSYCNGSVGQHVGLAGSSIGINYQLYRDGATVGGAIAGTGAALDFGILSTAGVYSVSAMNPLTSCTRGMTGSATVTVNALPEVFAVIGGGGYCPSGAGVAVGLAGSTNGISYRLYNGATLVSTVASTGGAVSFGLQTGTGVYTVSAINMTTGCVKNMAGSATVSINPLPAINNVTGGGSYCEGGTGVNIGLASTQSGVHYQLYRGTTIVGSPVTGSGAALTFGSQTVAGVYTVMATNTTSCVRAMSGAATVAITSTVVPTVDVALSTDNTICAGTSVTFSATAVNGGTTPTYEWYVNSLLVSAGAATHTYNPANGDIISVTMTSSAACAVPAAAAATTTMIVNPTHTPAVTITPDPAGAICKGLSVTFTATPVFGGTAPTYSWIKNGVFAGAGASYSVTPDDNDVVYCMMTSNYACRTASTVTSNSDTIDVVEPLIPEVMITTDQDITKIHLGQFVTFNAVVTNGGTTPEFQWIINGDAIVGATTTAFVTNLLKDNDTVTIRIRSSGPCGGNYSFNTIVIHLNSVGVVNVPVAEMDVRVMPNPSKGDFTIKGSLGTTESDEVNVEITNMLGQVVYKNTLRSNHGAISENVSLDNSLSNGMYLLNLRAGERSKVFHISVSR